MKIIYAGLICLLSISSLTTYGQHEAPSTEGSSVDGSKATKPFLGIAVNIPLWKVFGKKKIKALPEPPTVDQLNTLDSTLTVVPKATELAFTDTTSTNLFIPEANLVLPKFGKKGQSPAFGELSLMSADGVQQEQDCYDTYNVTFYDNGDVEADFMYRMCFDKYQFTPVSGGGGGGLTQTGETDKQKQCRECKAYAQRERDLAMDNALSVMVVGLGASVGAAGLTFVETNAVTFWAHFFPGIGTVAAELLATAAAGGVGLSGIWSAASNYLSSKATIENSYYKDLRDCQEKFCN